jgi:drug/metabolite transporter (DMT)-like permease
MQVLIALVGLPELLAILSSLTYGVAQVLVRVAMRDASALAVALVLNGSVAAGGFTLSLWDGTLLHSTLPPLLWYLAVGVVGPGVGRIMVLLGIEKMGLSRSTTIAASAPVWGTLAAIAFLGERPSALVMLGTLGVVGGVAILGPSENQGGDGRGGWFQWSLIYPLTASIAYALPPVFSKFAYSYQPTPYVGMAVAFSTGNILLLVGNALLGRQEGLAMGRRAWPWLLSAGLLSFISSLCLWTAFVSGSASTTLPLSRLVPLWVLLLSYFCLRTLERIGWREAVAAALVVLGAALITAFR